MTVQPGARATRVQRLQLNNEDQMTQKQFLLLPLDKAQELSTRIVNLAIPYSQSRPMVEILENAKIVNAEPQKGPTDGIETQQ